MPFISSHHITDHLKFSVVESQLGELVSPAAVVSLSGSGRRRRPTGVDSSALALPPRRLPSLPRRPGEQCGPVQQQHPGTKCTHAHIHNSVLCILTYCALCSCLLFPRSLQSPCLWCLHETTEVMSIYSFFLLKNNAVMIIKVFFIKSHFSVLHDS